MFIELTVHPSKEKIVVNTSFIVSIDKGQYGSIIYTSPENVDVYFIVVESYEMIRALLQTAKIKQADD